VDIDPRTGSDVPADKRADEQRKFASDRLANSRTDKPGTPGSFYMDKAQEKDGVKTRQGVQRNGDGGHREFEYKYGSNGAFSGGRMHEYGKDGKDPSSYYALTPGKDGAMEYKRYDIPSADKRGKDASGKDISALDWRPADGAEANGSGIWGQKDLVPHTQQVKSDDGTEQGSANGFFGDVANPDAPPTAGTTTPDAPPVTGSAGASAGVTTPPVGGLPIPQAGSGNGTPPPDANAVDPSKPPSAPDSGNVSMPPNGQGTPPAGSATTPPVKKQDGAGLPEQQTPPTGDATTPPVKKQDGAGLPEKPQADATPKPQDAKAQAELEELRSQVRTIADQINGSNSTFDLPANFGQLTKDELSVLLTQAREKQAATP
jgi:hypothetical protein